MGELPHEAGVVHGDPVADDELLEESTHLEEVILLPVPDVEVEGEELHGGDAPLVLIAIRPDLPQAGVPARGAVRERQGEVERRGRRVEVGDLHQAAPSLLEDELMVSPLRGQHAHFVGADLWEGWNNSSW